MADDDLGLLSGNTWRQWGDASGLIYYQNLATPSVTTYCLPAGWEDTTGVSHFYYCFTPADRHSTGRVGA